ncbi:MAG TPA: C4-type zinc ribbon domain-containing protein [Thermoanaerobaculia bacterium]|nr:C4-type zinc ribbon domain-containing protein [Thermoanaerobaculia bacterium]
MNNDVEKLWELQTVLTQLNDREKQLTTKPEAFAAIDREWHAANDEMTSLEGQIETSSKERRRVDGELADQQELLKKYQGQLMQVKNQQQYAAAWKEIDAARKHVKELEDAELKAMSEVETLQKQLDERKGGSADLKTRWDAAHETWQSSLGQLQQEAAQLRERAAAIESQLPPRVKDDFYRIYNQRQKIAVTLVAADSCSGCRTRVRPQVAQQLKRGELVHCEGCRRILYVETPQS